MDYDLYNILYFVLDRGSGLFYNRTGSLGMAEEMGRVIMKVTISAEENGQSILCTTLTFPDKREGLEVAHMLEAFARNRWQTSRDRLPAARQNAASTPMRALIPGAGNPTSSS